MEYLLKAILLGIIQGITEWLPISSMGHLRLAEYFLNLQVPVLYDVTLHVGTLIVVFFFLRTDIKHILTDFLNNGYRSENGKLVPMVIVGTIPTALVGLVFSDMIESTFRGPLPIAMALLICGILLYSTKFSKEKTGNMTYKLALVFGAAQGLAIIPGMSRSGTTIATALLLGLRRQKSFRFSFLLSIPATIGALGLTLAKQHSALFEAGLGWTETATGSIVGMIVGYFALRLLWKSLEGGRFHLFAVYCWLLAAVLIALSFRGF